MYRILVVVLVCAVVLGSGCVERPEVPVDQESTGYTLLLPFMARTKAGLAGVEYEASAAKWALRSI